MSLMRWLIPREVRFFDDFERQSECIVRAASLLNDLVHDFVSVPETVKAIKDVEHAGDQVTHEVIARLHATFVTPIDRHDIHVLTSRLDDVLDYIDAAASALHVYRVKQPTPECRALAGVVLGGVGAVDNAVKCLRTLDATFYRHAETVHEHEHRADQLLRQSLASLFEVGGDAVEVLKWKEIYETLEGVTDRCEDVINTIEAIMLKDGVGRRRPR
jgi:predicted phosphate transport protein (TIGR00153 family)